MKETKANYLVMTESLLFQGMSSNGGWSTKQIKCLGEDMKKRGWRYRIQGKEISRKDYERFLELKNNHLKNRLGFKNKFKHLKPTHIVIDPGDLLTDTQLRRFIIDETKHGREMSVVTYILKQRSRIKDLEAENEKLKFPHIGKDPANLKPIDQFMLSTEGI